MNNALTDRSGDVNAGNRGEWFSAPGLFAAGLFCLVLGVFLGNKLIAAGQIIVIVSLVLALFDRSGHPLLWKAMPVSGWLLVAFAGISAVSIFANWSTIENPLSFLKRLRYYLIIPAILLIPSLYKAVMGKIRYRDALVLALLISMLVSIGVGFITWTTGRHPFLDYLSTDFSRFAGLLGQIINFSYTMQLVVVALAVFFWRPSLWKSVTRVPWWVVIPLLLLAGWCQYLTDSRGAMLGVLAGFVTFALMRSFKLILVILAIGVLGGGFAYLKSPRYFRYEDPVRINFWKTALLCFVEHPVTGVGYRNFEVNSIELKERYGIEKDNNLNSEGVAQTYQFGHAHNNYLEALASTGVFGGVAFLGFCGCWTREALRSRFAFIYVPLITTFLVSGLFTNTFFDSETLNVVLLIYLVSQWTFHWEKSHPHSAVLPGLTTTDT